MKVMNVFSFKMYDYVNKCFEEELFIKIIDNYDFINFFIKMEQFL